MPRYVNPWPGSLDHGLGDFLKWQRERRRSQPAGPPPSFERAAPRFDSPRARAAEFTATWVGHASVLLQLGDLNVLTDPIWSDRASPVSFAGPLRRVPPGVPFDSLPPIDLILISHNHYDHLDAPTVRRLVARDPGARWVAPLGVERWLRRAGARHVTEHGWWDRVEHGESVLQCVPARHFSARSPFNRNRTWWCGWTIVANGWRAYFAGDTGYHPDFGEIARRGGPFDVALLPIGAYEPRWFMQQVHMNPDDALRAYADVWGESEPGMRNSVRARPALLPIHWGTFELTDEPLDEPPQRIIEGWHAAGHPPEHLWLLHHGETRRLSRV